MVADVAWIPPKRRPTRCPLLVRSYPMPLPDSRPRTLEVWFGTLVAFAAVAAPTCTEGSDHTGLTYLLNTTNLIGPTLVSDVEGPFVRASSLVLGPMTPQLLKGPPAVVAISVVRPQRVAPPVRK